MKYTPHSLIVALLLILNIPLLPGFFAEDDFDHLLATQNTSEFTGRPGWFNYTPVPALAWMHALHFAPDIPMSYIVLRLYSVGMQLACGILLFHLSTVNGVRRSKAFAAVALFLVAPLTFEGRLRLNCLHYWCALAFMLAAFSTAHQWMSGQKTRWLILTFCMLALCLFSSVHGVVAIPGLILYMLCIGGTSSQNLRRVALSIVVPAALLSAVWLIFFLSLPVNPHEYRGTTIGGRIVTLWNVMLSGFTWHPTLWIHFADGIGNMKVSGRYPILFLGLCAVFTLLLAVFVCRTKQEPRWAIFCFAMLIATALIPPKSYWMPRYSFFALPWIASLTADMLSALVAGWKRPIRATATVACVLLLGSTAGQWHKRYTQQHLAATGFARALFDNVRKTSPSHVILKGVPQWIGAGHPWPSCTSWIVEFDELLHIIGHPATYMEITYRESDQSTNTFRVTSGERTASESLTLSWPPTMRANEMTVRTIKSSVQVSAERPPAADL